MLLELATEWGPRERRTAEKTCRTGRDRLNGPGSGPVWAGVRKSWTEEVCVQKSLLL